MVKAIPAACGQSCGSPFPRSLAQSSVLDVENDKQGKLAALDIELVEVGEPLEQSFIGMVRTLMFWGKQYMSRIDLIIDKLL